MPRSNPTKRSILDGEPIAMGAPPELSIAQEQKNSRKEEKKNSPTKSEKKKVGFYLDKALAMEVNVAAAREGRRPSSLVEEALRTYLGQKNSTVEE